MTKETGGPAFPVTGYQRDINNNLTKFEFAPHGGMTLRDWFAGKADIPWGAVIETLARKGELDITVNRLAEYRAQLAYIHADAMLKARGE